MTTHPFLTAVLALSLGASLAGRADDLSPNLPEGFALQYSQDFNSADALKDFQFSDPNAWRWTEEGKSGGALENHQQSKYETVYRSPFNIGLIAVKAFGDFVLEADMMQTSREYGHRDMCLFLHFVSPTEFYYTHLATAPDPNAHNIFIVNNAARKNMMQVPEQGIDWGTGWQRVRVERIGGKFRIFFNDMEKPVLQHEDSTFTFGHIGFGSFDDTGLVDNIRIWAKDVKETPDAVLFPKD